MYLILLASSAIRLAGAGSLRAIWLFPFKAIGDRLLQRLMLAKVRGVEVPHSSPLVTCGGVGVDKFLDFMHVYCILDRWTTASYINCGTLPFNFNSHRWFRSKIQLISQKLVWHSSTISWVSSLSLGPWSLHVGSWDWYGIIRNLTIGKVVTVVNLWLVTVIKCHKQYLHTINVIVYEVPSNFRVMEVVSEWSSKILDCTKPCKIDDYKISCQRTEVIQAVSDPGGDFDWCFSGWFCWVLAPSRRA